MFYLKYHTTGINRVCKQASDCFLFKAHLQRSNASSLGIRPKDYLEEFEASIAQGERQSKISKKAK
jgi:hypothetical protein